MNRLPSPRQADVLRFIAGYVETHGYPPTRREIGAALGITAAASTNAIHDHLAALERKGFVRLTPGVARGIVLSADGKAFVAERDGLLTGAYGHLSGPVAPTVGGRS